MSALSTPFCNAMITVSGPTSGGNSGSADSVSYNFTVKRATSTGPTANASLVAVTRGR